MRKILTSFLFLVGSIYAGEIPKNQVDTFYLVQEYLGDVRLSSIEPHWLSCAKEKCRLLKRGKVTHNFFTDKNCKKVDYMAGDPTIEYSCQKSQIRKLVLKISPKEYFELLSLPKTEEVTV